VLENSERIGGTFRISEREMTLGLTKKLPWRGVEILTVESAEWRKRRREFMHYPLRPSA
jgi:hypothetical protein